MSRRSYGARSCIPVFAAFALTVIGVQPADASFISAVASCFVTNVDNSQQTSTTPGVAATATLPAPHACTSTAIADYGLLELGTTITGNHFSGNVSAQYYI